MKECSTSSRTESAFSAYTPRARSMLLQLRSIICDIAKEEAVGPLTETLKWGQPSYLTESSKSGTTIRIDAFGEDDEGVAFYVHCQTSLVEEWRERFPMFAYEGNRCVRFTSPDQIEYGEVRFMIADALTYHRRKRRQTN